MVTMMKFSLNVFILVLLVEISLVSGKYKFVPGMYPEPMRPTSYSALPYADSVLPHERYYAYEGEDTNERPDVSDDDISPQHQDPDPQTMDGYECMSPTDDAWFKINGYVVLGEPDLNYVTFAGQHGKLFRRGAKFTMQCGWKTFVVTCRDTGYLARWFNVESGLPFISNTDCSKESTTPETVRSDKENQLRNVREELGSGCMSTYKENKLENVRDSQSPAPEPPVPSKKRRLEFTTPYPIKKDREDTPRPPSSAHEPPTKRRRLSNTNSNTNGTPSNTNGTCSNTNGTRSNTNGIRSNTDGTHSNTYGTRSYTNGTRSNTNGTRSNTNGIRSNTDGTHSNTYWNSQLHQRNSQQHQRNSQQHQWNSQLHQRNSQLHQRNSQLHQRNNGTRSNTNGTRSNTNGTPSNTNGTRSNTNGIRSNTDGTHS
eukprot:459137_1